LVTPGYGTAERSVVREYGARFRELAEVAAELAAAETVVEVVTGAPDLPVTVTE